MNRARRVRLRLAPLLGIAGLGGSPGARAHDFQIVNVAPSPDWCELVNASAGEGDVVFFEPGTYPGGCTVRVGGLVEHNEALLLAGLTTEVTIDADADGLSLRVLGDTTRLFQLTLAGRLEVAVDRVTVDSVSVGCLEVDPAVSQFTLLFSEVDRVELDLVQTVVRGNRVGSLTVWSEGGLVADNTVYGDLSTSVPAHRNLVLGDLSAGSAFANVVVGGSDVTDALYGNTLLGPVSGVADARNNLTTVASLAADAGNLRCPECLGEGLDVQPRGAALDVVPLDAPGHLLDFCATPRQGIGAVGPLGYDVWSAFDRSRAGCAPGSPDDAPPGPPAHGACETPQPPPPPPPPVAATGCSTAPAGALGLSLSFLLLRRRSR